MCVKEIKQCKHWILWEALTQASLPIFMRKLFRATALKKTVHPFVRKTCFYPHVCMEYYKHMYENVIRRQKESWTVNLLKQRLPNKSCLSKKPLRLSHFFLFSFLSSVQLPSNTSQIKTLHYSSYWIWLLKEPYEVTLCVGYDQRHLYSAVQGPYRGHQCRWHSLHTFHILPL